MVCADGAISVSESPAKAGRATFEELLTGLIRGWRRPLIAMLQGWQVPNPVDIAQDVFAELWLTRDRFAGEWEDDGNVGAWLRGIAWNLGAAAKRSAARAPRPIDNSLESSLEAEPGSGPGDAEEAALRRKMLRAAVNELPTDQRTVILMCAIGQTPIAKVAALLGVSPRSVEGRLYRARKELGRILVKDPHGGPSDGCASALGRTFQQEARRQEREARS